MMKQLSDNEQKVHLIKFMNQLRTPMVITTLEKIYLVNSAAEKLGASFIEIIQQHLETHTILKHTNSSIAINLQELPMIISVSPLGIENDLLYLWEVQKDTSSLINELTNYKEYVQDYKTIFDISFDVLYVTDSQGITLRVSPASEKIWGLKTEEMVGRSVLDLEKAGVFYPSITRRILERKERVYDVQETMTGKRIIGVGIPIKNNQGDIIRIVNAARDMEGTSEIEEELRKLKIMVEGYRQHLAEIHKKKISDDGQLIYRSKAMDQIVSMMERIAIVNSTVLIHGESGVGKEVIANYIHHYSPRKNHPFIKINCAAIPENLLESELFGYEKGTFTGGNKDGKAGLFELAHQGTLFLDEIGDMPLGLQAKLLRVLQDKRITRLGSYQPIQIDVRIITATNQDLVSKVDVGYFRQDLYYRLNVIPITILPLRERKEDIVPLLHYFLEKFCQQFGRQITLSQKVIESLESYPWPGNVRELQNVIERLVVITNGNIVDEEHLPAHIKTNHIPLSHEKNKIIDIHEVIPLKEAVNWVESRLLQLAQEQYKTTTEMAKALGIDQSTVSRKLQKYM